MVKAVPVISVNTEMVEMSGSFPEKRSFTGLITAKNDVGIGFARPGKLEEILVKIGEEVEKNEELAKLDNGATAKSPFDGKVVEVNTEIGAPVHPGFAAFRLVQSGRLEARVNVPFEFADDLALGDRLDCVIGEKEHSLEVDGIAPELNGTSQTRWIRIVLPPDLSKKHRPGDTIKLDIERRSEVKGFWVPSSALKRETRGLWSLYEMKERENGTKTAVRHYVELLYRDGGRSRVTGSPHGKVRIVTDHVHKIVPGQVISTGTTNRETSRE